MALRTLAQWWEKNRAIPVPHLAAFEVATSGLSSELPDLQSSKQRCSELKPDFYSKGNCFSASCLYESCIMSRFFLYCSIGIMHVFKTLKFHISVLTS